MKKGKEPSLNVTNIESYTTFSYVDKEQHPKWQTQEELKNIAGRTFCQKFRNKCMKSTCTPVDYGYLSLRQYACCCLPSRYVFERYEWNTSENQISIYVRDITLDPRFYSQLDLKLLVTSKFIYLCSTSLYIPRNDKTESLHFPSQY